MEAGKEGEMEGERKGGRKRREGRDMQCRCHSRTEERMRVIQTDWPDIK